MFMKQDFWTSIKKIKIQIIYHTRPIKDLEIDNELSKYDICNVECDYFINISSDVLKNTHLLKNSYAPAHECMPKYVNKAIM